MSNASMATTAAYVPPPQPQQGGWHTKLTYGKGNTMPDNEDPLEMLKAHEGMLLKLQEQIKTAEKRNVTR
jgi:hypothetical protein